MPTYYLAVDGGGTKTDVVCVDTSGSVVGRGLSGPTNLTSTSVGAASFNLVEAIRQAVETLPENDQSGFPIMVMGLAGIDSQKEYDEAFTVFSRAVAHYKIEKFILVNDSVIALENGSEAPNSIILISGTGSICFGRNESQAQAKTSGMDYLLTDQGSGYAIGRRVLREAVKSFDGRAPKSILEDLVCEYFKIPSIADLKNEVYHPPLNKIEVADLAPLCSTAFERSDSVAKDIFDRTIAELVTMVMAVVRKLELDSKQFDLVLSGSVTKVPYINQSIAEILRSEFSQINIVVPKGRPVFGAVKLALEEAARSQNL